jgi:hypothetical protein
MDADGPIHQDENETSDPPFIGQVEVKIHTAEHVHDIPRAYPLHVCGFAPSPPNLSENHRKVMKTLIIFVSGAILGAILGGLTVATILPPLLNRYEVGPWQDGFLLRTDTRTGDAWMYTVQLNQWIKIPVEKMDIRARYNPDTGKIERLDSPKGNEDP